MSKGLLIRASIGICLDGALIGFLFVGIASEIKQEHPFATEQVDQEASIKAPLTRMAKMQAAFERIAAQKSNNLSQLAGPAIEYLREAQSVMTNYYLAT